MEYRAVPGRAAEPFPAALWTLLTRQAARFTGCDHSSMTAEQAQELLRSLLYTLSAVCVTEGVAPQELLADADGALRRGRRILLGKRETAKEAWARTCLGVPDLQNAYLIDTLRSIGSFFERYDVYYGAHQIPCSIDYPLLCPVPERLAGVSYVEEYLRRLAMENRFLRVFPSDAAARLLSAVLPSYRAELLNLCDGVLINAVGRALLGLEARPLDIAPSQRRSIGRAVKALAPDALDRLYGGALDALWGELSLPAGDATYFHRALHSLSVRTAQAARSGDLSHLFLSLPPADGGS